jgi:hypothetical protein
MLGILFVDFFNFYNSLELLNVEIRPMLPHEHFLRPVLVMKDPFESFIQIRGKIDQIL